MRNKSVGVGVANINLIAEDVTKFIIVVILMSEKRYRVMDNDSKQLYCIESVDGEMFSMQEIVELLNKQQDTISQLEEEKGYWKSKAMTLLMQVRRLTPRMSAKEVIEFAKELDDD